MFAELISLFSDAGGELWRIVGLSLGISLSATVLAGLLGVPLGAWLAVARFRGRAAWIVVFNAFMGLPPVVVGLVIYLLLSRRGPLGDWGLLFTPGAMVMAQAVLVFPIVVSLSRQVIADAWIDYEEPLRSMRVSTVQALFTMIRECLPSLGTALLAGLGRAIAEVGAVMIVGGNIAGVTRVMTTTIALETSKGNLPLALGLGMVLIGLTLCINALAQWLTAQSQRASGPR